MAEIVDPTVICRNFPTCPMVEILRDNLLDTLDRIFQGGTGIVSMEGTDGIGKTILLRQFALRHHDRSISLFIQPISRLSYAPEYLRLALAEQVHWIVSGNILDTEIADESLLRTLLIALQKRSIRERAPYYFCIDGLDEIPRDDPRNLDFILKDLLPLGMSGFRFLFTGDFQPLFSSFTKSTAGKPFSIPFFSLDDSSRYLSPLNLGPQAVEDLHRMCKGIPGHLAVVARLLHAGTSVSTLLEQDLDNLPDFLMSLVK